jgi:hypothetical protein
MKKHLILFLISAIAISCVYAGYQKYLDEKNSPHLVNGEKILVSTRDIVMFFNGYRTGIINILHDNKLSLTSVEKISFSIPGDNNYGTNPKFELFNSQGGKRELPRPGIDRKPWFKKYSYSSRFIFTLGNRTPVGSSLPELVGILPDVKQWACQDLNKHNPNISEIPKVEKINLALHPQEVPDNQVVFLPFKEACVQLPDGKYYYYQTLIER